MAIDLQNAKGTKDLLPEQAILKKFVEEKLVTMFELHGFSPMETPILEREEMLTAKYAGGAEILKEMFRLKDQGERNLALRYDLTVPLARFMGMNSSLKMPFKRYQMGSVFRDGPVASGRLREFTQCDIDIVGASSMLAEAECISVAQQFFKALGLDVEIEINNRKVLDGIMESFDIHEEARNDVIIAIDKMKKVPLKEIEKEIAEKGVPQAKIDALLRTLETSKDNHEEIKRLRRIVTSPRGIEGLNEIEELLGYVNPEGIVFSVSLARGLAYYTGTVYEAFHKNKVFTSALAAGGRYDEIINSFLGDPKGRSYPAVGISFGIDRICFVLQQEFNFSKRTVADVFVIPIGVLKAALDVVAKLRSAEINTDVDIMGRGISKNLQYADSLGIPYALIVGENEVTAGKYTLHEMDTGKEEKLPITKLIKKLQS